LPSQGYTGVGLDEVRSVSGVQLVKKSHKDDYRACSLMVAT